MANYHIPGYMQTATDNATTTKMTSQQRMMCDLSKARLDAIELVEWLQFEIEDTDCEAAERSPGPALGTMQHVRQSLIELVAHLTNKDEATVAAALDD